MGDLMVKPELTYKQKLVRRIERKFIRQPNAKVTIKLKKKKLILVYMYGGRYAISLKEPGKKLRRLNILASADKIVDIIIQQKIDIFMRCSDSF